MRPPRARISTRCIRCTARSPALAALRKQYVELRRGRQVVRAQSRQPGLFAASRFGNDGREILVVFNTSTAPITAQVEIETGTRAFTALVGRCPTPGRTRQGEE